MNLPQPILIDVPFINKLFVEESDWFMKKFLGILVLGLLWCNTAFAASSVGLYKIRVSINYPIEKSKLLRAYFHKKKPKPKPEPTYTFEVFVESNVLRTDSYLVSAKSEAEAKSLVESGLLEPDDTRYPDSELEIKYGVIKNVDTGKTLSWEK